MAARRGDRGIVTAGIVMIGTGLLRSDDDGASEPPVIEDQAAVEPLDSPRTGSHGAGGTLRPSQALRPRT